MNEGCLVLSIFFYLNRKQYMIQHSVTDTFIKYTQNIYCSVGLLRGTGMSLEFSRKAVDILRYVAKICEMTSINWVKINFCFLKMNQKNLRLFIKSSQFLNNLSSSLHLFFWTYTEPCCYMCFYKKERCK